jgi:hypothetical protein
LRGLGVTCGAPPLAQKRSVGVATGVIVEGSHAYPVRGCLWDVGGADRRWAVRTAYLVLFLFDQDDFDETKGVRQVRVDRNSLVRNLL